MQNPRERCDWPKIIDHPFIKETESERLHRVSVQDNYRKWIVRLKNEKIFNLYECETFLAKFGNDNEVEIGTKNFSAFDNVSEKTLKKNNSDTLIKEGYWVEIEAKAATDEGATYLRRDHIFAEKVVAAFQSLLSDEKLTDKKLVASIVKILFNVLNKGKFENQNIDITKNQNILNSAMAIFKISQNDDALHVLLNDIIKVIGLFAKFYCYYSGQIDLNFCSGFLRQMPVIISQSSKPSNVHINLVKAVGIMITAANMVPKRSLLFYKSLIDFNIITVLATIVKHYKNVK